MTDFISISDVRRQAIDAEDQGRYVAAIILLEQCVQLNPVDSYAWLVLSDAYKAIGRFSASAQALARALEYAPDSERWIVEIRLATLATKQGLFKQAEKWFLAASTADGVRGLRWPLILRGANLIDLQRFAQAEELLRQAFGIEGESDELDEAYHTLGVALIGQGKYAAATEAFRGAAEINPDSTQTKLALKSLEGVEEALSIGQQLQHRSA
jgi:tetratricopeptide (TPR) repeat protein